MLQIKPDGSKKARLCLDPKDLNKNICREHYYSRTIDEILPLLHGMTKISGSDTTKGYYHIELDYESSLLCTFITPYGRFRPTRLPFGVKVSQDVFQRKLDEILKDVPNVAGIADDILVYGRTDTEHDLAFINMLETCRQNNVGLNSEKLQFKKGKVKFFGHTLTPQGLQPAEDKLKAIQNIKTPTTSTELLTVLGMINYLNRFSVKLAEHTAPLRKLTKKGIHFRWEAHHQAALDKIKEELSKAKIISFYDPNPATTTILQCDASQIGLGAWIRQIDNSGNDKIVAMALRALNDTEKRYSNIERECLAVVFGLEKFEYCLYGREVIVETDHSPLEQIFKKNIAEAPARLQRLLLRCLKFDVKVQYKPGKSIPVADALSRVCITELPIKHEVHFITTKSSPIDIEAVKEATMQDTTMNRLKDVIFNGWPDFRKQCPQELWGLLDIQM